MGGGEGKEESEKIVEYVCNVQLAANRPSKCQHFFNFSFINDNRKNISSFVF